MSETKAGPTGFALTDNGYVLLEGTAIATEPARFLRGKRTTNLRVGEPFEPRQDAEVALCRGGVTETVTLHADRRSLIENVAYVPMEYFAITGMVALVAIPVMTSVLSLVSVEAVPRNQWWSKATVEGLLDHMGEKARLGEGSYAFAARILEADATDEIKAFVMRDAETRGDSR